MHHARHVFRALVALVALVVAHVLVRTVSCESCHAPLASHVSAGKRIAAMAKDSSYQLCLRCHRGLARRPASVIKQVVPEEHVATRAR